jgi:hypothetical protein
MLLWVLKQVRQGQKNVLGCAIMEERLEAEGPFHKEVIEP